MSDQLDEMRARLAPSGIDESRLEAVTDAFRPGRGLVQTPEAQGDQDEPDEPASIYNTLFDDAEGLLSVSAPSITKSYQWAVACGADLSYLNGYYMNDLPTGLGRQAALAELAEDWGVESKTQLRSIAASLKSGEYSTEYAAMAAGRARGREAENMRQALQWFTRDGLIEKSQTPSMLIWDLARLIIITRLAFDATLLTRAEALQLLGQCALKAQNSYKSWQELSVGFQLARHVWAGADEEDYLILKSNMQLLLTDADSPWVKLKFNIKCVFSTTNVV